MKITNYKNNGLTLIEALIWFAIFAAVIAGVFSLYSNSRDANNSSTINKEITTIYSQTENVYSSNSTSGLTNLTGLQLGIFPQSVKVIDPVKGTINNIYGGNIILKADAPTGFNLTYENIPKGPVCSNIIRSQKSIGWDALNGSVIKFDNTYSISGVSALCGQSGTGTIQLTFEKWNRT